MPYQNATKPVLSQTWWKEAVVYQVYPRSFRDSNGDGLGDIGGIIQKLDYFNELGINVLWLSPVYESPNDDNGYDISDYQAILSDFGTMADFDELLKQAHDRDIKVLMDLVINHTSDEHAWFQESRSSKASARRDWYIWRDAINGLPNNWQSIFSEPTWSYDALTDSYYFHTFSSKQPDLNWENPEVRSALYAMVRWWLDKGVDGFRIDAITHIKKQPGFPDEVNQPHHVIRPSLSMYTNIPGILDHISELCDKAFSGYDIMTVGEASGVSFKDAPSWIAEDANRFNMIFQFEQCALWSHGDEISLDIPALKQVFKRWQTEIDGKGWNALFVENHDIPRVVSHWGDDKNYWQESATAIAAMYFLMQGTPFIYQGQELGMTNYPFKSLDEFDDVAVRNFSHAKRAEGWTDEEILKDILPTARDNSRTPMQWDSTEFAGFSDTKPWLSVNPNKDWLNYEAQKVDENSVFHFYQKLIQLRKQNKTLIYGSFELLLENHPQLFCYRRYDQNAEFIVLSNLSPKTVSRPNFRDFTVLECVLGNYSTQGEKIEAFETRVYKLK